MGPSDGDVVGISVGISVGCIVGSSVCETEGSVDMGACDGSSVAMDGLLLGRDEGSCVDGRNVSSSTVGCRVGSKVGKGVIGSCVGATVGLSLHECQIYIIRAPTRRITRHGANVLADPIFQSTDTSVYSRKLTSSTPQTP